jgi:SagB-type dehydrogenase family enzyme
MKRRYLLILLAASLLTIILILIGGTMVKNNGLQGPDHPGEAVDIIPLPPAARESQVSVEQALWGRRSVRSFSTSSISLEQAAQLLWAAQGISDDAGHRTAPSAGALYPLEVYLVAGQVDGLEPGIYHYLPKIHALRWVAGEDIRGELAAAALNQDWMADAPAMLAITAVFARTNIKYGDRTTRYVYMEVGLYQKIYTCRRKPWDWEPFLSAHFMS